MKRLFALIIVFLLSFGLIRSQEPNFFWGLYAGYNINTHFPEFQELPGYPNCCKEFTSGSGNGFSFGVLFEKPLNQGLNFVVRLGYMGLSGDLIKDERNIGNTQVLDNGLPKIVPTSVQFSINSYIHNIGVEPAIHFRFFNSLMSIVGVRASYLFTAKFDQQERLTSPSNVTFLDGRLIQNDFKDQDIPDVSSFIFHGFIGLGAEFPVFSDATISPELRYYIPVNDITSVNWSISSLQLGAAIKFPVYSSKDTIVEFNIIRDTTFQESYDISTKRTDLIFRDSTQTISESDDEFLIVNNISENYVTLIPLTTKLVANVEAIGINHDGRKVESPSIIIEEIETEELFPLLPYVFFLEGSSELNKTSMNLINQSQIEKFSEENLEFETIQIYSNLLNIVGARMRINPDASITIVGTNNQSPVETKLNSLSQNRAEALKKYLTDTWKISENRIKIKSQNLPDKLANNSIQDGLDENRRAEIYSNDNNILAPVFIKRVEKKSNPPKIELVTQIKSALQLDLWNLEIEQSGTIYRSYSGKDLNDTKIWEVEVEPIPNSEEPIFVTLKATDIKGNIDIDLDTLTIQQKTIRYKREEIKNDTIIERFSLILFDYDKSEIKPIHEPVLDYIKSKVRPGSVVTIYGYADRTGDRQYNKELANMRCNTVLNYLDLAKNKVALKPQGSDVLLYDNNLAEGRSYSRTVKIIIETPIK